MEHSVMMSTMCWIADGYHQVRYNTRIDRCQNCISYDGSNRTRDVIDNHANFSFKKHDKTRDKCRIIIFFRIIINFICDI